MGSLQPGNAHSFPELANRTFQSVSATTCASFAGNLAHSGDSGERAQTFGAPWSARSAEVCDDRGQGGVQGFVGDEPDYCPDDEAEWSPDLEADHPDPDADGDVGNGAVGLIWLTAGHHDYPNLMQASQRGRPAAPATLCWGFIRFPSGQSSWSW